MWRRVLSAFRFIKAALCRGDFAVLGCLVGVVGALHWRLLGVGLHRFEGTLGGRTGQSSKPCSAFFRHPAMLCFRLGIFSADFL